MIAVSGTIGRFAPSLGTVLFGGAGIENDIRTIENVAWRYFFVPLT